MLLLILLGINLLMGATFSMVRLILESYTNPLFLIAYRMTLSGILFLSYLAVFKRQELRFAWRDFKLFAQVSFFHIYLAYICEVWGLRYLPPAKVALLFNLTPFITALFGFLIHGRKQNLQMMLGLGIGFVGFLPILLEHTKIEQIFGEYFFFSVPEIMILISICSGAYAWLLVEKLVHVRNYSPLLVNGVAMLSAGILTFPTAYLLHWLRPVSSLIQPWPYTNLLALTGWVLGLILISNLIFYNVYAWLMKFYTPSFLAFSGLTIPIFAAGWEWLFFGESVSQSFWLSFCIILAGLLVYYRAENRFSLI